jgi:hypothetical protein
MNHAHYGHEGCLRSAMAGAQTGSPLWWPVMVVVESGNDEMVLSCEL